MSEIKAQTDAKPHYGPVVRNKENTFKCPDCHDWGAVNIFAAEAMKAMREGRYGQRGSVYTATARCHCEKGDLRFGRLPDPPLTFDPKIMVALRSGFSHPSESDVEALRPFCSARRDASRQLPLDAYA